MKNKMIFYIFKKIYHFSIKNNCINSFYNNTIYYIKYNIRIYKKNK